MAAIEPAISLPAPLRLRHAPHFVRLSEILSPDERLVRPCLRLAPDRAISAACTVCATAWYQAVAQSRRARLMSCCVAANGPDGPPARLDTPGRRRLGVGAPTSGPAVPRSASPWSGWLVGEGCCVQVSGRSGIWRPAPSRGCRVPPTPAAPLLLLQTPHPSLVPPRVFLPWGLRVTALSLMARWAVVGGWPVRVSLLAGG